MKKLLGRLLGKGVSAVRPTCTAILAAAGSSQRMGGENKLLLPLDGMPVLAHTLRAVDAAQSVDEIVIAAREEDLLTYAELCKTYGIRKPVKVVVGGATREESVLRAALEARADAKLLAVQDGARPLVTPELFDAVVLRAAVCAAAAPAVREIRSLGYQVILATNPLFPAVATQSRIRWAGLTPEDFERITTYENARFCKPNPDYYQEILGKLNLNPSDCLMVGNDVDEDMIAETLGMRVFLLTDCLINRTGKDISRYPSGGFTELLQYVRSL